MKVDPAGNLTNIKLKSLDVNWIQERDKNLSALKLQRGYFY